MIELDLGVYPQAQSDLPSVSDWKFKGLEGLMGSELVLGVCDSV